MLLFARSEYLLSSLAHAGPNLQISLDTRTFPDASLVYTSYHQSILHVSFLTAKK